uniref:RRM domain-containing protein n=1 Tax=Hyaloperonospora arabidopsidis (strain Emoy2) TaxID=559515 RepID=M4BG92_HYAAE
MLDMHGLVGSFYVHGRCCHVGLHNHLRFMTVCAYNGIDGPLAQRRSKSSGTRLLAGLFLTEACLMTRDAASPSDSSSSSGFSSDDSIENVPECSSASSYAPNVHVEVLDESNTTVSLVFESKLDASIASLDVLQCCRNAVESITSSSVPQDVSYEQFTATIGHVTLHWPSLDTGSRTQELVEDRLSAYAALRAAVYRTFHQAFPLTEDMYSQWISDCSAKGDSIECVKSLFELAHQDYWSVSLTLQYLRFVREHGDKMELEAAMKKAQTTLGTHFARGHEVWALCRDLTAELYDEQDERQDVSLKKERAIRDLFCRQMQLPLEQNDLVMSEFRAWNAYNTLDAKAARLAVEEASTRQSKIFGPVMKKLRGFEVKVQPAGEAVAHEVAWLQYLNFVKHRIVPLMSSKARPEEGKQVVVCLSQVATWIAYLESIRHMNAFSIDRIRTMVFEEAVQCVTDAPNALAEAWLVFEREYGDLASYLHARQYHAKHQAVAQANLVQVTAPSTSTTHGEGDKQAKGSKKRKAPVEAKQKKELQQQSAVKRAKLDTSNAGRVDVGALDLEQFTPVQRAKKKQVHEHLTTEHTLFLCNVSKGASKDDIEEIFRDIPTLKGVRLVAKTRGDRVKSRGMAYVQFTNDAGAEAGLKMNGWLLHQQPLRVERSKPPASASSNGGSLKPGGSEGFWKTDPLTLYVGNLNREGSKEQVTEEQLQASLQQAMQSVDRHGKLKNYGLVEVAEPSHVAICLGNVAALQEKLGDQVTLKPSRFSISHILEQQQKQQKQKQQRRMSGTSSETHGGAASRSEKVLHSRPSTRLVLPSATSLMPRALRRKLAAQQKEASKTEAGFSYESVTPKSNEDFRKMLFDS